MLFRSERKCVGHSTSYYLPKIPGKRSGMILTRLKLKENSSRGGLVYSLIAIFTQPIINVECVALVQDVIPGPIWRDMPGRKGREQHAALSDVSKRNDSPRPSILRSILGLLDVIHHSMSGFCCFC